MTAPGLQALMTARRAGETVGVGVLERGLQSLLDARLETGAFQYATRARKTGRGFEAVEGAIGRMPACEATLLLAGKSKVEGLRAAVLAFFEHWPHLEDRRSQTGTHKPPFQIAPYYFYYAHFYAAQAIELLPEEERSSLRGRLDRRLAQVREQSGGWNDRVFDRSESFGTAMVILALCSPQMPRPAGMLAVVDDDRGPEAP